MRLLLGAMLVGLVLLLVFLAADILLVVFAGIVLAVVLRGLALWVSGWSRLSTGLSLAAVIVAIGVVFAAAGYFLAPRTGEQFNQLITRLPADFHRVETQMEATGWGKTLIHMLQPGGGTVNGSAVVGGFFGVATTTITIIAGVVILAFIGLYGAADPRPYVSGALRLAPPRRRERLGEIMQVIAVTLRWWIIGRLISMCIIAVLTAAGLWLIGVQLALVLGLLAGVLTFVPYIGSVTSAIPSLLIALTESASLALYVVLLYIGIHVIDGYIVAPLLQRRMVHLPPALTLCAQAILGALFGILGLVLAEPLTATIVTATKLLYVEDVLHDPPPRRSA